MSGQQVSKMDEPDLVRAKELLRAVRDPIGISFLQCHLGIGYSKAIRLMAYLVESGFVYLDPSSPCAYLVRR